MTKTRLEAFSDGVLAIIITIMVLELKVPHGTDWEAVKLVLPALLSYIISFVIIGIYWANHHHLIHTVGHVNSRLIWANLHLLFWLSLVPFATNWMGENDFGSTTVAVYAGLQFICGMAFYLLVLAVEAVIPENSPLIDSLRKQNKKGVISGIIYFSAIPAAYIDTRISGCLFLVIAMVWFIPDKSIEKLINEKDR